MIERGGHWGRHYMAPLAGPIHTDAWQRLELLVRRLSGPQACGAWHARRQPRHGLAGARHAREKEERPRLMGSQRTGVPATGPVRCKG